MVGDDIVGQAAAGIRAQRTTDVVLRLLDPAGQTLPTGSVATVEQVRHQFLFGGNTYAWGRCGNPADDRTYADRFRALFTYATLPFYWGSSPFYPQVEAYEGAQGVTREGAVRELALWCARYNITTKGHPLIFFRFGQYQVRVADGSRLLQGTFDVEAGGRQPLDVRLSRAEPANG